MREPLLHFVVVGFVLFAVGQIHRERTDTYRIVVSPQREALLANRYALQFGTQPNPLTRAALVQRDVEEEMLFRQGLALGLDKEDEIVRRRIVQKMRFLLQDSSAPAEPEEAQLNAYYRAHSQRYVAPARVTFSHVFFSSEKGEERAYARAKTSLARLVARGASAKAEAAGAAESGAAAMGDPFPDLQHFSAYDAAQVQRLFGRTEISEAVFTAPAGRWAGPYKSSYGWHLIWIDSRQAPAQQPLSAVLDRVRTDYLLAEQARANQSAFSDVARAYTVVRSKS
jgi:parvulin-like peptidyl-prolyl isomerase